MEYLIVLNGEKIEDLQINSEDFVICADGALNFLNKKNITPNLIVGDFDSLGFVPENSIQYPTDKDLTDGEIALIKAKELGAKRVRITCAGGFRDDHFLGNLALLEIAENIGIFATIETRYSEIYLVTNSIEINVAKNCYVSLIALENSTISYSNGLKYEYNNTKLLRASTLGVSNVTISDNIELKIDSGKVLLIVNKTKK